MIENVNSFAVSNITTTTERDFKSQYLFHTCSVANKLMTSLEFNPILRATRLCHFGQTQSSYVAIPFTLCGSTATSCATGDYVTVPERFSQYEEPASTNEERTGKNLVLLPKVDLTNALLLQTCRLDYSIILCVLFK